MAKEGLITHPRIDNRKKHICNFADVLFAVFQILIYRAVGPINN